VVFLFDEPLLGGRFRPENYGWSRGEILGALSDLISPLISEKARVGFHCCGEGPWDPVFETPAQILHLDAWRYGEFILGQPAPMAGFLRRGGRIAWGICPTSGAGGRFPGPGEVLAQWRRLEEGLGRSGFSPGSLGAQSLFSTSCGLGGSKAEEAGQAVRCLAEFVRLWKPDAGGA
jgi:hypothetical protein